MTLDELKNKINHYVTAVKGRTAISGYRLNELLNDMLGFSQPYKSYVARITQSGTDAPTAAVIVDEIGGGAWSRASAGFYNFVPNIAFDSSKTAVFGSVNFGENGTDDMYSVYMYEFFGFVSVNTGLMQSGGVGNPVDRVLTDGKLSGHVIEIRVYN